MIERRQPTRHLLITFLFLFLTFLSESSYCQDLMLLKGVEYEPSSAAAGLGQSFRGDLMENGQLYFLALFKLDGRSIWKTDGTPTGTAELIIPDDYFHWQTVHFLNNSILIDKNDDHLYLFNLDSETETDLGDIGEISLTKPVQIDDNKYIMLANNNDQAELWTTDLTQSGTFKMTGMGPHFSSFQLTASTFGAVLYRTSSSNYQAQFYNFSNNTLYDLLSLLSPIQAITEIEDAYLHDKYIFINGRNDNQFISFIYDVELNTIHSAPSLREVNDIVDFNGITYIVNQPRIHRFDPVDVSLVQVVDRVAILSNVLQEGHLLYHVHNPNDFVNYPIHVLDMATDTTYELPTTNIGRTNYGNQMALYNNRLYYTKRDFPHTFLYQYNFQTSLSQFVDTVSVNNGSITVSNVVKAVGGHLVVSVYDHRRAHELYYLDGNSGTLLPYTNALELQVQPNPAQNFIELEDTSLVGDSNCSIFSVDGQLVKSIEGNFQKIDISELAKGTYFGMVSERNEIWRFTFIKQ